MVASSAPRAPVSGAARGYRPTIGGLRLASGLVLFIYVFAHLANHAVGNISLAALEGALQVFARFWGFLPVKIALYGAFAVHTALGLWALYVRRPFRYRPGEAVQLGLGLLIPYLLFEHIIATRLGHELYGFRAAYTPLLHNFFVIAPGSGAQHALTTTIVWLHGCIGLYYWLRLKPFYPGLAPWLLGFAVLVPVVSLLGYFQAGREVMRLAADPAWRPPGLGVEVPPNAFGTLGRISAIALYSYLGLIGAALLARSVRLLRERQGGLIAVTYPDGRVVRVPAGTSVLEASRLNAIPHAAVCGGKGRCSTCRVRIVGGAAELPPPSAAEQAVLDRIGADEGMRLACQLRPTHKVTVAPLVATDRTPRTALHQPALGEERFVVAMFVDMRGSTSLAEHRLPFDTVFVINRFLEAVGGAVAASGGSPNQFLGDGMMALFGLEAGREEAARQALAAIGRIQEAVAALNEALADHLDEPLRYGIGLHAGPAILGEIGDRRHGGAVFTAIGDAVNVASRLQGLTKRLGAEALVSDAVVEAAGESCAFPRQEVEIDGRSGRMWVRLVGSGQPEAR